jgi:hypothetical protein
VTRPSLRYVLVLSLFGSLFLDARLVTAQVLGPLQQEEERSVQFLPRYAFHLGAAHLSSGSNRLVWDTNFGGEIDFIDYGFGRATFGANYQAILGKEIRAFDPNQGNYTIDFLLSARRKGFEAAALFYHQSRHLSDRSKQIPIDWNMVGARLGRTITHDTLVLETRIDARRVVKRTTVDYRWELQAEIQARRPLSHGMSLIGGLTGRMLGVDGSQNRGNQQGYRAEGGLRFQGKAGAVELFMASEQRIDPYPLEFGTARLVSAGFRFLGR